MAVPSYFPENGLQSSKTRTIIKEESGSSNSIDELFSTARNKNSAAKPLKDRKLPPSFFQPSPQQSPKNGAYHSRDSSSDSTSGVCSPPLQMKTSFNENASVCSNENANLMLQYINSSQQITHSRAHSSPATLQASLQKGTGAQVSADVCSPVNSKAPSQGQNNNVNMIYHERFLSYDNSHSFCNVEESVLHRMQSSPTQNGQLWHRAVINRTANQHQQQLEQQRQQQDQTMHEPQQQQQEMSANNHEMDTSYFRLGGYPAALQQQHAAVEQQESNLRAQLAAQTLGSLPDGWEMAVNDEQHVYFIDHHNKSTQWTDPRIPRNLQHPCGYTLVQLQELHARYRAFLQEEQLMELSRQKETLRNRIEEVLTKESRLRQELSQTGHADQLMALGSSGLAGHGGLSMPGDKHTRQESSDSGLAAEPVLTPPPVVDMNCTSMSMSPEMTGTSFDASGVEADELYPSLQEPLQAGSDEWLQEVLPEGFGGFV